MGNRGANSTCRPAYILHLARPPAPADPHCSAPVCVAPATSYVEALEIAIQLGLNNENVRPSLLGLLTPLRADETMPRSGTRPDV
jgi:hypothetical protein